MTDEQNTSSLIIKVWFLNYILYLELKLLHNRLLEFNSFLGIW